MPRSHSISKKSLSESRKNAATVRYPNRGERMAGDDGSCLSLKGDGFGDSRQSDTRTHGLSAVVRVPEPTASVREMFLELRAPICRYLMSLGLQRAEAEDVAQESFLRLCEQASHPVAQEQKPSDKGGARMENVRGWIFRVAHNLAQDEHRRRKRRPTEELRDDEEHPVGYSQYSDGRPSPEETLLEREQDARLKAALARLPEQQRQCLHLRAEGLRYREMAEVLGVGTSTVAEWVQKGLKQLERELA
jgi:RNA polymerase sigma-70 factor (ECF subfamily)